MLAGLSRRALIEQPPPRARIASAKRLAGVLCADRTVGDHVDPICHLRDGGDVRLRHQDPDALVGAQPSKRLQHSPSRGRSEELRRLVDEEEPRCAHQRDRERNEARRRSAHQLDARDAAGARERGRAPRQRARRGLPARRGPRRARGCRGPRGRRTLDGRWARTAWRCRRRPRRGRAPQASSPRPPAGCSSCRCRCVRRERRSLPAERAGRHHGSRAAVRTARRDRPRSTTRWDRVAAAP
jgi:hypothetical protein